MQARCKSWGQAAAPRWVPGTRPKCLTFVPLLVSPSWLCALLKMIWMIVIWQLLVITSGQLSVSNTEKYTILPHCTVQLYHHAMCCTLCSPPSAQWAHNTSQLSPSWPALNSSWYLGLILRSALRLSSCLCYACSTLRPMPSWAPHTLWSQWPRFHASFSAVTSDKWRIIEQTNINQDILLVASWPMR